MNIDKCMNTELEEELAFTFCVAKGTDKHTKLRFKRKIMG